MTAGGINVGYGLEVVIIRAFNWKKAIETFFSTFLIVIFIFMIISYLMDYGGDYYE